MTLPLNSSSQTRLPVSQALYGVSWRLAVLLMPLQTRWFSGAMLAGWPWEQGQWSFYVSWLPMIATIILGFFLSKKDLPRFWQKYLLLFVATLAAVTVVSDPVSFAASVQWWIQMLLLASFFITLLRTQISLISVLNWFVLALIPHALFAIVQVYLQFVPGWSWIGVATQMPTDLGVSVIQTERLCWLRAYGGFPHPNILGGWMAAGLLLAGWLVGQSRGDAPANRRDVPAARLYALIALPVFSVSLFYSFSRSAWIGFGVGAVVLIASQLAFAMSQSNKPKQSSAVDNAPTPASPIRSIFVTVLAIFVFVLFAFIHWELTASRMGLAPAPRLEVRSVDARAQSLWNGIRVFQAYPLFGTGPNAELPALTCLQQSISDVCDDQTVPPSDAPLEPPHNVWILMLANMGTVGALIIFGFLLFLLSRLLVRWRAGDPPLRSLVLACIGMLLAVSIFDHYLWSLWSGQVLLLLCGYLILSWIILTDITK